MKCLSVLSTDLAALIFSAWSVGNDVGRQDDEDDDAVKAATDRVRDLGGRREARHR